MQIHKKKNWGGIKEEAEIIPFFAFPFINTLSPRSGGCRLPGCLSRLCHRDVLLFV